MSKRMKEEERIERIIRGLLKLPDNRRCINCNSLGPQYICTTFWTFVCTRCSGVHREFTHRVKSVSMARFNDEEVCALEAGGNERAKEIYFKTWDPNCNSYPDPSQLHKLRDFIKHVYVDRKYTGERGRPIIKGSIKDDISSPGAGEGDKCSIDKYSPRKRSDNMNTTRSFSNIEERTSPLNYNHCRRSSRERSLPARFEIVDNRFRDDKRRGDVTHIFSKSESRSSPVATPPKIKSINDILGDKVIPLKVADPPADAEKTPKEKAPVNLGSLIDLETEPQPEPTTPVQQTATAPPKETGSASTPADNNMNLLESLFIDMSTPAVESKEIPAAAESTSVATVAVAAPVVSSSFGASLESTLALPGPNDSTEKATDIRQNQHSAVPLEVNVQQSNNASFEVLYDQKSTTQPARSAEAAATNPLSPAPNTNTANDPTSIGRKELPADLFTSSYPPFAAAIPGWQFRPPGMMYGGMQYHPAAMPISTLQNSARSRNPFDVDQAGPQVQAPEFPCVLPMQAALPNLPAPINVQPQQLPYALAMPPQASNYGGAYAGPNNKPQGNNSFGKDDDSAFASLNPLQQSNNAYPMPATSNSFSSKGGNPFG